MPEAPKYREQADFSDDGHLLDYSVRKRNRTMIPFYEPYQLETYQDAVAAQVASGWIGPGARVRDFEELLAKKVGAKYAVATNSGTSAIMASIWALGMEGKRCLFPAYGYPAGANAARMMGCEVILCDVTNDGCLNLATVPKDFLIGVRHNGNPTGFHDIHPIIDDSAVALGIKSMASGVCRTYSFSVPKLITTGQGGAVTTDQIDIAEAVRAFIDQGGDWRETRRHSRIGVNLRMADINAALGIPQLERLEELVAMRREIRSWYRDHIDIGPLDDAWCVTHQHPNAKGLRQWLKENGILSEMLYRPMNENPCYECRGQSFPNTRRLADETLYLPSSLSLTEKDVATVCNTIGEFKC